MKIDVEMRMSGGFEGFINAVEDINKAVQEEVCMGLRNKEKGKYKDGKVCIADGKRRIFGSMQAPPDRTLLTELEKCAETLYDKLKKEYGGLIND